MKKSAILEKIELVSNKISFSNILNKKEAYKIVDYYNLRFSQCLKNGGFEELENQINEYMNKWFVLQEEYNLDTVNKIDEIKDLLSNSLLNIDLDLVLNEINEIFKLHTIGDSKYYSISFVLEHIKLYLNYINIEIENYSEIELEEENKSVDKKECVVNTTLEEKGEFNTNNSEQEIDKIIEKKEEKQENLSEIILPELKKRTKKDNLISFDQIRRDNNLNSLKETQNLLNKKQNKDESILLFLKDKIKYIRRNFNNLFFYRIKLLSIIKEIKYYSEEKRIYINNEFNDDIKSSKIKIKLRDNVDSIVGFIGKLKNQKINTGIIVSLNDNDYLGINSFSLLKGRWLIDEHYVIL